MSTPNMIESGDYDNTAAYLLGGVALAVLAFLLVIAAFTRISALESRVTELEAQMICPE